MKTRKCGKCDDVKPISEFYACIRGRDGLFNACKSCCKERNAAWRQANPEGDLRHHRDYRRRNPDKVRKIHQRYRQTPEGIEKRRASQRQYDKTPRGRLLRLLKAAKGRCSNPNNKDYKFYSSRGIKFLLSKADKEAFVERWTPLTKTMLNAGLSPSLDRIDPNRSYENGNLRIVTWEENALMGLERARLTLKRKLEMEQHKQHNGTRCRSVNKVFTQILNCAEQRCNNKNNTAYARYGGHGVEFLLTKEDRVLLRNQWYSVVEEMLNRDISPSIHRQDSNKGYELDNITIVSKTENSLHAIEKGIQTLRARLVCIEDQLVAEVGNMEEATCAADAI